MYIMLTTWLFLMIVKCFHWARVLALPHSCGEDLTLSQTIYGHDHVMREWETLCFSVNEKLVAIKNSLKHRVYSVSYPSHRRHFDLHPPPPRIFRSRGSLITPPPSPQEFPEFLNRDFFMSKWFWYFKKTKSDKYGWILLQQCQLLWRLLFT